MGVPLKGPLLWIWKGGDGYLVAQRSSLGELRAPVVVGQGSKKLSTHFAHLPTGTTKNARPWA